MARPLVIFPDVVAVVLPHLAAQLAAHGQAAPVAPRVPSPRPAGNRFVVVRRVGGAERNLVMDAPQIGVEAYDDREDQAERLCQWCRTILKGMAGSVVGGATVYRVVENVGPYPFDDPVTQLPRYRCVLEVHVRGVAP